MQEKEEILLKKIEQGYCVCGGGGGQNTGP